MNEKKSPDCLSYKRITDLLTNDKIPLDALLKAVDHSEVCEECRHTAVQIATTLRNQGHLNK